MLLRNRIAICQTTLTPKRARLSLLSSFHCRLAHSRLVNQSRSAATLVEFALVALITVLILAGFVVGGMGVYRFNLVATLAREGSRYASVHGLQYQKDTGKTAVISFSAILSYLESTFANNDWRNLGLDPNKISGVATWSGTPGSVYGAQIVNNQIVAVNNTITVTIHYSWIPEGFTGIFGNSITLTSTSVIPMTY